MNILCIFRPYKHAYIKTLKLKRKKKFAATLEQIVWYLPTEPFTILELLNPCHSFPE